MAQVLSPGALPEPEYQPEAPAEWEQNLSVKLMCPECREDPPNLVEDTSAGDVICESCGIVLSQRGIDQRAEWRTFANDDQGNDDPSRVGDAPNPLLHGNQLQTNIAFGDGSMRSKELHRAQSKATADKGNKNLLQAFKQIGAYCDGSKIPSMVADTAKHMFKDADESKVFKGKSNEAVIASCIFLACRRHDFPRSFREVYDMTKVTKKEIGRTFKLLEKVLKDAADKKAGKTSAAGNGKSSLCSFLRRTGLICLFKVCMCSTKCIRQAQPPIPKNYAPDSVLHWIWTIVPAGPPKILQARRPLSASFWDVLPFP